MRLWATAATAQRRLHHAVPTSSMISSNSTLNVPLVAWREIALAFRRREPRRRHRRAIVTLRGKSSAAAATAYSAWTAVLTIHIQLHRRQKGPQVAVVTAARPLHNFQPPLCTATIYLDVLLPKTHLLGHAHCWIGSPPLSDQGENQVEISLQPQKYIWLIFLASVFSQFIIIHTFIT